MLPADVAFVPEQLGTLRLLSIRCVTKFLYERRQVPVFEPFRRLFHVADATFDPAWQPGDTTAGPPSTHDAPTHARNLADRFGSDALRLVLLQLGPCGRRARFCARDVWHMRRFLDRVWREVTTRMETGKFVSMRVLIEKHTMIYRVTQRLEQMKFHTALAAIREFVNFLSSPETTKEETDRNSLAMFVLVLAPFTPHLAAELWERLGMETPLDEASWPEFSDELVHPPERDFPVLVDGKMVARMMQPSDLEPEKLESRALDFDPVRELIAGRDVARVIVAPGKLVSIVLEHPADEADGSTDTAPPAGPDADA